MDVFDDLANVGLSALNFLGFDVNNLGQLFRPLPERPINIRHRSIIRRIGSRLPLKHAKRLQLQNVLLERPDVIPDNESIISELSCGSSGSDNQCWVEEDLGNNCIIVRSNKYRPGSADLPTDTDTCSDIYEPDGDCQGKHTLVPFDMSVSSTSAVSATDSFTQQKITALEDELASVKLQVALLVKDQEKAKSQSVPCCSVEFKCPPPPCPPPPTNTDLFKAPQAGKCLAEALQKHKDDIEGAQQGNMSARPCMDEVLKDLGNVKLRMVQRSPGGTPLKTDKPKLSDNLDPATMIALALKKKFANSIFHSPFSPESEKDDHDSPDNYWPPFGQHVLKKTQKRSLLFQGEIKSESPFQEIAEVQVPPTL